MAKTTVSIWIKVTLTILIIGCSSCAKTCCREHTPVAPARTVKRWVVPPIPPWGANHYWRQQKWVADMNNAKIDREAKEARKRAKRQNK